MYKYAAVLYNLLSVPFCHLCIVPVTCMYFVLSGGGHVYDVVIAGIAHLYSWEEGSSTSDRDKKESGVFSHPSSATHSPTPPPQRRLAKSFSVAPTAVTKGNYGFLLLASVQLCHCSAFVMSFCHFHSICLRFCFNPMHFCLILNLTFSILFMYKDH